MKQAVTENKNILYNKKNGVEYIQFRNLLKYENIISHCFTTRLGGISADECESLNMGFNRKDKKENVQENFRRITQALDISMENMVFSNQVHDCKIKIIAEEDRGKGIYCESDIIGYDGLATNRKDVAIVTFFADCVPIFFLDPNNKAIAVVHSGWRGTVKRISAATLNLMEESFGCRKKDIEISIGPSIGECCFEVGNEVCDEFIKEFSWSAKYIKNYENGKKHINLQEIIKRTLEDEGADSGKVIISNICTKCNKDVFFSHRGDNGKTGSMAGIMQLR